MPNITAFLSYIFITLFTPGPNTLMSMSNSTKYGVKKSIPFIMGIFFGFFIIMVLSSIFSITLYGIIPFIKPFMAYIGAMYILYLAWKTYKSKPHSKSENGKVTNSVLSGFLLQFVNPKVILFCITTVSTFIVPFYNSTFVIALFCVVIAFAGFLSNFCWALFGSIFQKFILKKDRIINTIMALLLVYCAVSLFL